MAGMSNWGRRISCVGLMVVSWCFAATGFAQANLPNSVLNTITPPGCRVGASVDVTVAGGSLDALTSLVCNHPGVAFKHLKDNQFRATIADDVPVGCYEVRAVGRNGLSSPRSFTVGNLAELRETNAEESTEKAQTVPFDVTVNGVISKGGDRDDFRFTAKAGQQVVIECWAERIDSPLRAVLELYDDNGRRLATNRGYFGIDPLIVFTAPAEGSYVVRVFDLVYSGSTEHFYRLDLSTAPRVVFSVPAVIEKGKTERVTLYGWNLKNRVAEQAVTAVSGTQPASVENADSPAITANAARISVPRDPSATLEQITVEITAPENPEQELLPIRLHPSQTAVDGFAYRFPGSHAPVLIGVSDVPVIVDRGGNHSPKTAREIVFPSAVSGQLSGGNERDWYALNARRGEVLWINALAERIGSPVDLDVSLFNESGDRALVRFQDEVRNIADKRFPSQHLDPSGRWVVPADGRYLIVVRNLTGGLSNDPRRGYVLSVHREEPDFDVVVIPRPESPASLNVMRNGRVLADLVAYRRRGMTGAIRVTAKNLPSGIECPPVWLGPGVARAPLVISAHREAATWSGAIALEADAPSVGKRKVLGGTMVRAGTPSGWGRVTTGVALGVAGKAPLRISANGHETRKHDTFGELKVRHSPGGVLDVAIHVERENDNHRPEVKLIGVGLPDLIQNQTETIPAGKNKGYISFYLPPTLLLGKYTIAVQATTTIPHATDASKTETVRVVSDPVTFTVHSPAFIVEIDPYAPKRIGRGETITVNYTAKRVNGFITKIHTELFAPDAVIGIRGRGVTFVNQTNSGTLQIIANDDAPLGRQKFLRFFGVGVVEDQPVYHGSHFVELEIVE